MPPKYKHRDEVWVFVERRGVVHKVNTIITGIDEVYRGNGKCTWAYSMICACCFGYAENVHEDELDKWQSMSIEDYKTEQEKERQEINDTNRI
jgi:hypothetical protein